MRGVGIAVATIAMLAASGAAWAQTQPTQPSRQPQTKGSGLFPGDHPIPQYATSANGANASLQNRSTASPNAGSTGLNGSGGTGYGWKPPAYQPTQGTNRQ
jgi:hypothetical protein